MAGEETQASSRIFISYRREDAIAHVNALFHPLRERFGEDRIFKDTDGIAPGQDFLKVIQSQLESCSVLLAVIGKQWLTVQKPKSDVRRLQDPTDYLRVEVATALKNEKVRVIPILVGQASMPAPEDLPADLAELAHRNGFELRDSRWESDVKLLIQAIERACGEPASAGPKPIPVPPSDPPPVAPARGEASPPSHDSEEFDLLEVRRKRQITEHVKVARQAFEALDYEAVLEACEKAVWLDPQQGEARDLARRARRALDEQKIQGWLAQAQELLARKELADAELAAASELIDQALSLNASQEAAVKLRQEVLALRKQRERQREVDRQVRAALVRAQASFDEEDFEAAIEHCDDALAVFGESAEALALRSKAVAAKEEERRQRELKRRAQQVVKDARAEFAAGQQEAALARLEQFSPPHDLIARALEELRKELQSLTQAREQKERDVRAQELVAAARSLMAAERFGDAATKLREAAGLGLQSPEIAALLREVEVAQAAMEAREREIQARQALEQEEVRRRREASERAAEEAEKARLLEAAAEQKRLMDARRAAEAAQRQGELGTAKTRLEDLLGRGELDAAERALQTAERQFESPAELRPLRERLSTLRRQVQQDELARQAVEAARADFRAGRHQAGLARLEQFRPAHDLVTRALTELRAEGDRIERERGEAARREAEAARQLAEAQQRRQRELAAAKAPIEDLLRRGDLDVAEQALAAAEKKFESTADFRPLRDRLASLRGQAQHEQLARNAVEEARREIAAGRREAALARLEQFRPAHDLVTRALTELRTEVDRIERERAEAVRQQARAERRQQELTAATVHIEDLLERGELDAAEHALATADHSFASPAELRPLHNRLDALRRLARHDRLAGEIVEQAKRDFEGGDHEGALDRLAQFAPPHDVVLKALQDLRAQLEDIRRHRSRAQDLIAAARNAIREKQFAEALERLHEAKSLWPDAPELSELLRSVQASIDSAERLESQIQQILARASKQLRRRDYVRAAALVDSALELDSQHSAALALEVAIQQAQSGPQPISAKPDLRRVAMYVALTVIGLVIAVTLTMNPFGGPDPGTATPPPPAPGSGPVAPQQPAPAPGTPVPGGGVAAGTPVPPAPTNIPPTAPSPMTTGPDIDAIHGRFTDALARNDLDRALRTIVDAEPAARNDPVIGRDLQRLVEVARSSTTQAFGRAQRANAATNAEADYKAGIARRTEANDSDKKGDKLGAVRSLMAASELFARAASAKPPSPPAGAQPGSGTSGPVVQNSGSPATAKPGDTPSQPVAENKPVEADRPPPVVRPPGPEPAERPVESPVPAPRGIGRGGSTPPQDADVAAIRGVLAQFEAGYRSLDAAAIRQVWPSAPAVNFNGVRSYEVTLQQADITLQGDTARVTCIRQVKVQNAAGKAQEARQRVTFTLHRGPAGWVILSVQ